MAEPRDDLLAELMKLPPATKDAVIDALFLPQDDQRSLADALEESIPARDQDGEDIDPKLRATLLRRVHEIETGAVQSVPWSEVKADIEKKLARKKP